MFGYPKTRDLRIITIAVVILAASSAQATIIGTGDVLPAFASGQVNADITGQSVFVENGTFTVDGGSILTADALVGASNPATTNSQILITGFGTTVNLVNNPVVPQNRFDIGILGTSSLTVSGGAVIDGATAPCDPIVCNAFFGNFAGSNSSLIVTGGGSRLDALNTLVFGATGVTTVADGFVGGIAGGTTTASAQILDGGVVNVFGATASTAIGNSGFGSGQTGAEQSIANVSVDGLGSVLNSGDLRIGGGSGVTGTLNVENEGLVNASGIRVGQNGGDGTLIVRTNGTVNSTDFVAVGNSGGTGELRVEAGSTFNLGVGLASQEGINIGRSDSNGVAGNGTVTVTGPLAVFNNTSIGNFANVGRQGVGTQGTLEILDGATYNGRSIQVGRDGATGTIIVDGGGSLLSLSGVSSGGFTGGGTLGRADNEDGGQGTLTVRNSGEVRVVGTGGTANNGGFALGRDANTTGIINVFSGGDLNILGSEITGGGGLTIGDSGSGTFNIDNATVSITGTTGPGMTIARSAGGTGALNITNGGSLIITATENNNGFGFAVGGSTSAATGGNGTLLVDGATSSLNVVGSDAGFNVGHTDLSTGTMTVSNGGTVTADAFSVGRNAGAVGTLNVVSGGVINLAGDAEGDTDAGFAVGAAGTGTATISGGGQILIDQGTSNLAGFNVGGSNVVGSGGTGVVTVTGAGSRIAVTGADTLFRVGQDVTGVTPTTGTVTVSAGGVIELAANGRAAIGLTAGSTGTVTVTGANSRIDAGAFLGIGRDLDDLAGGTGILNVALGGTVAADLVSVGGGGILTGAGGTIDGNVVAFGGGTVAPGSSPGDLAILGDLDLTNGGVLQIEIGDAGLGEFDRLFLGGTIVIDATTAVVFSFLGGAIPDLLTSDFIDINAFFFDIDPGNFDTGNPTVNAQAFDPALFAAANFSAPGVEVTIDSDGLFAITIGETPVPEPGALALFGIGLIGLVVIRRRRWLAA